MLSASVTVDNEVISSIGKGVLVFAAVAPGDTEKEAESMAAKVLKMKLWDDDSGGRVCYYYSALLVVCSSAKTIVTVEEECARHRRRSALWYMIP